MINKFLSPSLILLALISWNSAVFAQKQPLDKIAAVVNDDVITQQELDQRIKNVTQQMGSNNTPVPAPDVLRQQVLDYLINERLQLQIAEQNGIKTDDKTVDEAIARIAQQNEVDNAAFRVLLEKDGYSYPQFRQDIRDELTVNTVQQRQARSRMVVSDEEVDNFIKQAQLSQGNSEYQIAHILIALPENPTAEQIQVAQDKANIVLSDIKAGKSFSAVASKYSDGQQALDGGNLGWRKIDQVPYLFITPLISMKIGDTSDILRNSSGFHIIKLLDKKIDRPTREVEQTLARHILIKPSIITPDKEAKRTLTDLRGRIVKGADFGELAKEYSDDAGTASEGGDLGWSNPQDFDPVFAQEMQGLAPKQISEPFKTASGWHLLQVQERRTIDSTDIDQRNQVRQLIQRRKFDDSLQDWITELRATAHIEIK